jgi:hypothetical protein
MRKPKELPEGALERLAVDLKQAKTKPSFKVFDAFGCELP